MKAYVVLFACVAVIAARRLPMENPDLFEGDMLNRPSWDRNAVPNDNERWPKGIIPYKIDASSKADTKVILAGMEQISKNTCIKFVKRTKEKDYVNIFRGVGCNANWGRIGGKQDLSLGKGCGYEDVVVHELMHVIGFEHEHNREDRDDYLIIHWENIKPKLSFNFDKLKPEQERLLSGYDYYSIMHYAGDAFSKQDGLMTMESKAGVELLERVKLSKDDILRVKKLYQC